MIPAMAHRRPSLIAQEVRQVVPEIVVEPKDEASALGIRYSELIPVLISALQEQDQSTSDGFDQLSAENAELENRLAALEALLLEDRQVAEGQ